MSTPGAAQSTFAIGNPGPPRSTPDYYAIEVMNTLLGGMFQSRLNANIREAEIRELSSHFSGIFHGDHPCHLAIWGKTGTGKTLTLCYFLNLLVELCEKANIEFRHEQLDLSTPRPCWR